MISFRVTTGILLGPTADRRTWRVIRIGPSVVAGARGDLEDPRVTSQQAMPRVAVVSGSRYDPTLTSNHSASKGPAFRGVGVVCQSVRTLKRDGVDWPLARLFLVVSEGFAEYLFRTERSWRKTPEPHVRYEDRSQRGATRIVQILDGTQ